MTVPPPGDGHWTDDLHASAFVVGEVGVLVRGPSGAGKTRLMLTVVDEARRRGRFARVVADDRTLVTVRAGRLVARPHPLIAGQVERRGLGIVAVPFEPACVIGLVLDLRVEGWPARLPAPAEREARIGGVVLSRLALSSQVGTPDNVALGLAAIASLTTSS